MEKEDRILKEIVKQGHIEESPSMSFTPNVMRIIEAKKAAKRRPLIGRTGWVIVTILILGFISLSVLSHGYIIPENNPVTDFKEIKLVFFIIIITGFFIVFDNYLRRKRKTTT